MFADVIFIVSGALLLVGGFVFCFVPVIPGPPLAFLGLLSLRGVGAHDAPSASLLIAAAVLTVFAEVADYVMPAIGAKKFQCTRLGVFGSFAGTIAGLFFMPWGILVGPFLGAFLGELLMRRPLPLAMKGAAGAFLGFAAGLAVKLLCCAAMALWFLLALLK